jgi:hypothetical protein
MKAAIFSEFGGPEVLEYREVEVEKGFIVSARMRDRQRRVKSEKHPKNVRFPAIIHKLRRSRGHPSADYS